MQVDVVNPMSIQASKRKQKKKQPISEIISDD